jgi:hypothetical protein
MQNFINLYATMEISSFIMIPNALQIMYAGNSCMLSVVCVQNSISLIGYDTNNSKWNKRSSFIDKQIYRKISKGLKIASKTQIK